MKKSIGIIEGRSIKKYHLGKVHLPLTIMRKHLYRTDEKLFYRDVGGEETLLFTDLESTQVYCEGRPEDYLNPDEAIALMDTAGSEGKKGIVGMLGSLNNVQPMTFIYIAIGLIIILTGLRLI